MIDKYGYDSDVYNGTGGNNKTMQLVIDGMKLQKCNPGFADGRDAIILADKLNNNGENELLIWEVFARRGMGFGASQGSSDDRGDGSEDYEIPPYLKNTIILTKSAVQSIDNNKELEYTILANNRTRKAIRNVVIKDTLSSNVVLDESSLDCNSTYVDGIITMTLDSIAAEDSFECKFTVTPKYGETSEIVFSDDVESGEGSWTKQTDLGDNGFVISTTKKNSGNSSWFVPNDDSPSDYHLVRSLDLTGMSNPQLAFYQSFNLEETWDGGVVEIKEASSSVWVDAGDYFTLNGYNTQIQQNPASAISGRNAFSGNQPSFKQSILDLTEVSGQVIEVRFRIVSDAAAAEDGWYIDDIELSDAVVLTNHASATFGVDGATRASASTMITGDGAVNSLKYIIYQDGISIYPNPVSDILYVEVEKNKDMSYTLSTIEGKSLQIGIGNEKATINTAEYTPGVYILAVSVGEDTKTLKVVIE